MSSQYFFYENWRANGHKSTSTLLIVRFAIMGKVCTLIQLKNMENGKVLFKLFPKHLLPQVQ